MTLRRVLGLATLPTLAIVLYICFILLHPFLSSSNTTVLVTEPPHLTARFSLLIGILTQADNLCSATLPSPNNGVLVALEIMRFNDIIILNCNENMNSRKTYTYFSSLPRILLRRYDYVMKADDDVFLRLALLALSGLQPLQRLDLYYGFVIPCASMNPFVDYMSGMGFLLSWDIVEWISSSNVLANDNFGPEDKLVGKWLNIGKKAKNRFSNKPATYDYPGTNGRCSHDLIPDTVAVHRIKRWDQWLHVLNFFNVTKELVHSNLYSISFNG
ncbi:galactosyltransferase family protein [Actinidia rufa]|uniref:Hexosyltransferase n=1 Tax=Actinidia rufa TaxID=165716 RepID=A0A7J0DH99_9ERIC|nr:galactosyltransferase family protein [Actinidia rufa]